MKRTVNRELLKECIEGLGKNGVAKAGVAAELSPTVIHKMMADTYGAQPKEETRHRLAEALGVDHEDLFPLIEDSEAS